MSAQFKKYKWYILTYILYVSVVFAIALESASKKDFWPTIIYLCVTVPLAIYLLVELYLYIKKRKR